MAMTHALLIMGFVFQNAQTLKASACKVCTIKVTLYWFQGKTSAHIWCSGSRGIKEGGNIFIKHIGSVFTVVIEGDKYTTQIQLYTTSKKNSYFFLLQDICFTLAENSCPQVQTFWDQQGQIG